MNLSIQKFYFCRKKIMRNTLLLLSVLTISLLATSCYDEIEKKAKSDNSIIERIPSQNSRLDMYQISTTIGHTVQECKGCVLLNGRWVHLDCQGVGHACLMSLRVTLDMLPDSSYTATTVDASELTGEDFFNMPARSLCVQMTLSGKRTYLNIPAQLIHRDSVSQRFVFTGLFYTDYPYYNND